MVHSKANSQFEELSDFRVYLETIFSERVQKNRAYSLRRFAQDLKISHATLSHLLSGKRPITQKTLLKLGAELGLSPSDIQKFESHTPRSQETKPLNFKPLSIDVFTRISDWYHDAILEMTKLPYFRSDIKWIAKRLGISVSETRVAVGRLKRLGLIKITEAGIWKTHSPFNTIIKGDFTTTAKRKLQKQILDRAAVALEQIPKPFRENSSLTMAVHTSDIPEVKKRVKAFSRELCAYLERKGRRPNQVYQWGLFFYPVLSDEKRSHV